MNAFSWLPKHEPMSVANSKHKRASSAPASLQNSSRTSTAAYTPGAFKGLPRSRSFESCDWRKTAKPLESLPVSSRKVIQGLSDIEIGDILHMTCPPESSVAWKTETVSGVFGHPVLVMEKTATHVIVMSITSFDGKTLQHRLDTYPECDSWARDARAKAHLLIKTCRPNSDAYKHPISTMPVLTLENDAEMDKVSYLRRDRTISIEPEYLKPQHVSSGVQLRVTKESMAAIQKLQRTMPISPHCYW